MPLPPDLPPDPTQSPRRGGFLVILFTLTVVAMLLGAISLISVGFTIVVSCLIGFVAAHYVLWGWWLGRMIREEDDAENA